LYLYNIEMSASLSETFVLPLSIPMKKKVGRRESKQSICLVCGDAARIINYGALCCQACKTFFRRNVSHIHVGIFIVKISLFDFSFLLLFC